MIKLKSESRSIQFQKLDGVIGCCLKRSGFLPPQPGTSVLLLRPWP